MNAIVERFDRIWLRDPARPLIHLPAAHLTLTADDIQTRRRRTQAVLSKAGISSGHIIVSATGNRPGFVALVLAAWSVGASVAPVDVDTREDQLHELVTDLGACGFVHARGARGRHEAELDETLRLSLSPSQRWARLDDAAILKLTSGSTGAPKAVRTVEDTLLSDTAQIVGAMGIQPTDTQIAVIPLSHAYGFGNLVLPLLYQGTAMVLRESFVPQAVVADANHYGARVLHGVPFMFQHFAAHPPPEGWPASLSLLISAGAKLGAETIRAFWDRVHVKVHSFYGTSESGGIAYDHGGDVDDVETVGWPIPGVTVELKADEDVPAPYGRVYVRSRAVARGYVGAAGESSELVDGGFLTGDYGTLLADGRLVLAGRVSSFINVAGRKVQAGEVERVLRDIPGVAAAHVLAAADPIRGEQIAAVIVVNAELTLAVIRRHCADRLPPHKIPRVVVMATDIPMTARGKPDLRAMQAMVSAHAGRTE